MFLPLKNTTKTISQFITVQLNGLTAKYARHNVTPAALSYPNASSFILNSSPGFCAISSNSASNSRCELGGTMPRYQLSPYPLFGGTRTLRTPPIFIPWIPSSNPGRQRCSPVLKTIPSTLNAFRSAVNLLSINFAVYLILSNCPSVSPTVYPLPTLTSLVATFFCLKVVS
ncbi:hypothetical protein ACHAWC_007280 [Mediolabrus comicus]